MIACVLFINRYCFLRYLLHDCCMLKAGMLFEGNHTFLQRSMYLNWISAYTTNTSIMPNDSTTSSISNLASDSVLVSIVMDNIMNCVVSHILFSRLNPY